MQVCFRDMFEYFVIHRRTVPIALFRSPITQDDCKGGTVLPYVVTGPPEHLLVNQDDTVIAFAPSYAVANTDHSAFG